MLAQVSQHPIITEDELATFKQETLYISKIKGLPYIKDFSETKVYRYGKNLWDEQWELGIITSTGLNSNSTNSIRSKNYIPLLKEQTYFLNFPQTAKVFYFDANKNLLYANNPKFGTITITNEAYMRFHIGGAVSGTDAVIEYNNNICISLDGGDYEPYIEPVEVTASANGKVTIPSLVPITTLITNVNIEVTYQKSYGVQRGMQREYDAFWNIIQDNGNRTGYSFAFSADAWTPESFKPKYPIVPLSMQNGFAYWGSSINSPFRDTRIDLRQACVLDTSKCTSIANAFTGNLVINAVGTIDTQQASNLQGLFNNMANLEIVELLILKNDGTQTLTNIFNQCKSLTEIRLEGVIGKDITLQWSTKLSHASIESIINALSATTSGLTVTLSLNAVKSAFETSVGAADGNTSSDWQALVATKTNWTISLV